MRHQSSSALASGTLGVAAGAVLWTIGSWATPRPVLLAGLLSIALLMAGVTTIAGVRGWFLSSSQPADAAAGRVRRRDSLPTLLLGLFTLLLGAAFLCGVFWRDCDRIWLHQASTLAPSRTQSLRLVTFNALHGYPHLRRQEERYRDTRDALRALEPDVLFLQEAWRTRLHGSLAHRLAQDLDLHMAWAPANGSLRFIGFDEGSAVLSRFPILAAQCQVLAPRRPWWEARIAIFARLDLGEEQLVVAGAHLTSHNLEVALQQARDLAARLGSEAAIVAGDFNAASETPHLRLLTQQGMIDAVPGGIDHLLLSRRWLVRWDLSRAGWTLRPKDLTDLIGRQVALSDHPGIVVDRTSSPYPV